MWWVTDLSKYQTVTTIRPNMYCLCQPITGRTRLSPHSPLWLSHRAWNSILAQDSRLEKAVWMRLHETQKRPLPHHQQLLSSECETPHLSSTHHQCVVLVWHKETATWIENCTTLYCRMTINGNWTLNHMWKMTAFSCLFPKSQGYYITWCSGNMNTVLAERADTTYSDNSDTSGMTKSPKCFNISLPPTTILNMTMLHTHKKGASLRICLGWAAHWPQLHPAPLGWTGKLTEPGLMKSYGFTTPCVK